MLRAREEEDDGCPSRFSSVGWRFDLDDGPLFEVELPLAALARAFAIVLLLLSET